MTRENPPLHWAGMGETTFVSGIWTLFWIHQLLGRKFFLAVLFPVTLVHWLARPAIRHASLQYLQRLQQSTGALGHMPDWRDSIRHVFLFAETMLDKLLSVSGRYHAATVTIQGHEDICRAARAGQGGIIVTAHMGCLELCRVLAEQQPGFRLNILVHTRHAQKFNRVLRRLSPDLSLRLIEVSEISPATAAMLADRVAAGEFVAIAGDRVPIRTSKTTQAEFLGHSASFPIGPYILASLFRCPLYLMGCIHQGQGYALHFTLLSQCVSLPRNQREAALQEYAQKFASALTGLLQQSPYDWFNFYPFWSPAHVAP
jgi:predicted LPLAT superfamily acyltransferase